MNNSNQTNQNRSKEEQRKLAAIMFADIVGYSKMMSQDEKLTLKMLDDYNQIIEDIMNLFKGKVIKRIGDGLISEFDSAVSASRAAKELQVRLDKYNRSHDNAFELMVRIGIHLGDIVINNNDIFGDGVNVAARIEPLATPGGICISESIFSAVQGHPEFETASLGRVRLKNIKHKYQLYKLKTGFEKSREYLRRRNIQDSKNTGQKTFSLTDYRLFIILIAVIVVVVIYNKGINLDIFSSNKVLNTNSGNMVPEFIQNIQKFNDTEKLLTFLDEQKLDGKISFLDNNEKETRIGNWVIIADEKSVHGILKYTGEKYMDFLHNKSYLNLRDQFIGKRAIWFKINQ